MIETKYGVKYPMPHSLVHIVDNSQYTGALPTIVADDPSLYSTIVVTGAPIGLDNKVITVTRDDVLDVAYGLSSIGNTERKLYGQTIDYPKSIISQNAPVRLMRVTPDGSTYGVSCVLVQWRIDSTDNKCHVRFKTAPVPVEMALDKFKNTDRVNAEFVKYFNNDAVEDGDYIWKQRVFVCNVSAGRGKIYNKMATAINTTVQTKRPANIRYEFVTIDTTTNLTVERFFASLVNVNNSLRPDAITTANIAVGQRVEGSSIIIPYVNESAVHEVYNDYIANYKTNIDTLTVVDEFVRKAYLALNVNTFDIIYGRYIYNGSELNTSLPYYQVDMYDSDVPALPETNRITVSSTGFDPQNPTVLYTNIRPLVYGLSRDGDSVYVGDLYLNITTANGTNPTISMISTINQYSGAVTSLTIPKVYPLVVNHETSDYEVDSTTNTLGYSITTIFNDATASDGTGSKLLNSMVSRGTLVAGNIVAYATANTFKLFTVIACTPTTTTGDKYTLSPAYTQKQLYQALSWNSHSSGSVGVGNVIGRTIDDPAFTRVGATVIDLDTGKIYVNDYNYTYSSTASFETGRIAIDNVSQKFGTTPTAVNITTSLINAQYDIMVYDDESASKWVIKSATVTDGGSGYAVDDTVKLTLGSVDTTFKVVSVSESGAVTDVAVVTAADINKADIDNPNETTAVLSSGTGLTLTVESTDLEISEYEGSPSSISRYIVTGVQGSLFRIASDPTSIPANYYSDEYGVSLTSEDGGIKIENGSTGFFDDTSMNTIEFKWRYSALLVKAFKGELDPRIMSPTRVPAKYMFDGGFNTIVGTTILPYVSYTPTEIINASIIFTDDEKEEVLFNPTVIENITDFEDIDVKQAMYDLMIYRCYQGIPEDMRPVGPGSGMSLHLDSGITDANTTMLVNNSFANRFNNPNASWDIGGWVDSSTGIQYTFTKHIVDNLFRHCKAYTVNKPYTGKYTQIKKDEYTSFFPDIDTTDWDLRQLYYESGGNCWIPDIYGNLERKSQRTLLHGDSNNDDDRTETSDLIQESNMRSLSQLVYMLQNKIDSYLLEYDDDGVLKTLSDEVTNMFSNWVGSIVDALDISFTRDINIDGGEILVCNCNVTFRGLILRVPIIVNVNRRDG